jgi:tetratricopeptide (TPR) repeat protein
MIKNFIKLFILMVILWSNIYATAITDERNFQNEINNIKIEIEKLKVVQQYNNKDDKLKEIETSIKSLEDKFTKIIENVSAQDKRISDLSFYLALYGVIITILLLIISFGSYKLALSETTSLVQAWLEEKADNEFKPKVDAYLGQLQNKGDELLKQIETEASKQQQKHDDLINEKVAEIDSKFNELIPKGRDKVESDVKKLENKTESEYTYSDWYSKFLQHYVKDQFKKALEYIDKALENANNDEELLQALWAKALILGDLDKSEEEIKEYDKVINKFSSSSNEKILETVAQALFNKAFRLGVLDKSEEAIKEYDKVIDKFSSSTNEKILEAVARALVNKALRLGILDKSEEAIKEYDKVIDKFSSSTNEKILEQVTRALVNKIESLLITNQNINQNLKRAKELFKDSESKMIQYSMLEILYNAQISNQDKQIEEWKEKYENLDLGNWRFKEVEEWNNSMQDGEVKERIKKYIEIFKTKVKKH